MEKLYFLSDSLKLHDLPSFNTTKIRPQNKPKSNANRQKKNKKTIFNHFRDKPARACSLSGATIFIPTWFFTDIKYAETIGELQSQSDGTQNEESDDLAG
jgi:hypothetical protein